MLDPLFAGIDLGGTHARLCIYAAGSQKFLVSEQRKTSDIIPIVCSGETLARIFAEWFLATGHHPAGLAIGLPAALDARRKIILSSPNVSALDGLPIVSNLSTILGIPVLAERDVNFQFFHDLKGYGRHCSVGLGIYLGTGIGSSVWIDGFYTGSHGAAAELGHTPVHGSEAICACGNKGCLETLCSGRWLAGWRERRVPQTPMAEIFKIHADHPDLQAFIVTLAEAIASMVNLFDPELVFLGGGIAGMSAFPAETLKREIFARIRRPLPHDAVDIRLSSNSSDSGARGACLYAVEQFGKK